ncbi:MAG TPA: hypothetical protein VI248_14495 [Kineosporiaceae bacterium]
MTTTEPETLPRSDPAGAPPLPMAIAVLAIPPDAPQERRRPARLDAALLAYKLGYFLVDIVEVATGDDPSSYAWLEALAQQTEADAFICLGDVDPSRVGKLAAQLRAVVRTAPLLGHRDVTR